MPTFIDRTGQRYGRLVVLSRAQNIGRFTAWLCECDCGQRKVVLAGHLQQGRIVSCGCWKAENAKAAGTVHGQWGSKLHRVWLSMRQRCNNPRNKSFSAYGGRGIRVCSEWDSFEAFADWSIRNGYRAGVSIDRINNDGNYEPSNCRWVSSFVQANNTRKNHIVQSPFGAMTLSQLSRRTGINVGTLLSRIRAGQVGDALIRRPNEGVR